MLISKAAESALIDLASRGLWLMVQGDGLLQPYSVRSERGAITDDLKAQLVTCRDELLTVIPGLDSDNLALTGPVVRVLFARLEALHQQRPAISQAEFSARYDDLTILERVSYLWWLMDGQAALQDNITEEVA